MWNSQCVTKSPQTTIDPIRQMSGRCFYLHHGGAIFDGGSALERECPTTIASMYITGWMGLAMCGSSRIVVIPCSSLGHPTLVQMQLR